MPLGKAFLFCGWRVLPVDWLLDPDHDLSIPACQARVHEQLQEASFIAAALDCSTKSRAREIPRVFNDGRRAPGPLRSPQFPAGLPELTGKDKARVDKDNSACSFVLTEIEELLYRGGGSVRENPFNSLHWQYPQEVAMWDSGFWHDWRYAACCFGGARNKLQRIRHNIEDIFTRTFGRISRNCRARCWCATAKTTHYARQIYSLDWSLMLHPQH